MPQITVGTKNQIVIPKELRQKIAGLKPGKVVSVYFLDKNTVTIKVSDSSWLERGYGIMREAWKNTSPLDRLKQMRKEWDE